MLSGLTFTVTVNLMIFFFLIFCVKLVMHSVVGLANQRSNSSIADMLSCPILSVSFNLTIFIFSLIFSVTLVMHSVVPVVLT